MYATLWFAAGALAGTPGQAAPDSSLTIGRRLVQPPLWKVTDEIFFPVVDVPGVCGSPLAALVLVDDAAIAGLAAGHLWEFGFREFAYLGVKPDQPPFPRPPVRLGQA